MNTPKGTIYIVEDNDSFRKSMVRLLQMYGYKTVAFEAASDFLLQTTLERPGCILLDVRLPDMDGLELQKILKQQRFELPVVFMSGHGDIPMSVEAMKEGAVDFLPKPFDPEDLRDAMIQALVRSRYEMEEEQERAEINVLIDSLTPREKEVMRWVITGMLNKQIAYELGTSEKTIKVHRSRVMQKTKVSSVPELVRLASKVNIEPMGGS
ncbi:response regulator transcription factor [Desulfopila sp. IMCC35008]|uniref:response regulator transcription factor n=1 Tax=Desulfopila sp. IMCC35008 TaxID=2653858 RepID=UPI0013D0C154|nr:response regulator [Desulfopila sp. IMCC35008]